jgi:adenylate cyclase
MTVALDRLATCFEGVVPSIIATAAADGTPNVSYLSHVVRVDDCRVALSNQFFAKTAANVRANRTAALLVVCPRSGDQYLLDIVWETMLDHGPIFDLTDRALTAAIAQTGMAGIMRLRAVDIFRVDDVRPVPNARPGAEPWSDAPSLRNLSETITRLADQSCLEDLLQVLMRSACELTGCEHALVLLSEPGRSMLVTIASTGYPEQAVGSELPLGSMLIGQAGAGRKTLKINDLSRHQRMGRAALGEQPDAGERMIAFPRLPGAMSQVAVPMSSQGGLTGVLFLESERRLAFDDETTAALEALTAQASSCIALLERHAREAREPTPAPSAVQPGRRFAIKAHRFDDSVFIDERYVIKGVAGRLLIFLVERALSQGRTTFTNREIRRAPELRLPEFKDNLESRLLLLARRLEDKSFPVRLQRNGRGVMVLRIEGEPSIEYVD